MLAALVTSASELLHNLVFQWYVLMGCVAGDALIIILLFAHSSDSKHQETESALHAVLITSLPTLLSLAVTLAHRSAALSSTSSSSSSTSSGKSKAVGGGSAVRASLEQEMAAEREQSLVLCVAQLCALLTVVWTAEGGPSVQTVARLSQEYKALDRYSLRLVLPLGLWS